MTNFWRIILIWCSLAVIWGANIAFGAVFNGANSPVETFYPQSWGYVGGFQDSSIYAQSHIVDPNVKPDPIDLIQKYSDRYGVDIRLALALVDIESRFCRDRKNPTSSAKGCYQFIDSTFKAYCTGHVLNDEDNIKCAMKLLAEPNGIKHWLADRNTERKLVDRGFYF